MKSPLLWLPSPLLCLLYHDLRLVSLPELRSISMTVKKEAQSHASKLSNLDALCYPDPIFFLFFFTSIASRHCVYCCCRLVENQTCGPHPPLPSSPPSILVQACKDHPCVLFVSLPLLSSYLLWLGTPKERENIAWTQANLGGYVRWIMGNQELMKYNG